jgi:hypothetical protein
MCGNDRFWRIGHVRWNSRSRLSRRAWGTRFGELWSSLEVVRAEFGLYRRVSYMPIKSVMSAHWWYFDLDNLLGILLVVKTIAEHVSKRLQSSLGRVRNRLFLGLKNISWVR